jgi:hypothetical protein
MRHLPLGQRAYIQQRPTTTRTPAAAGGPPFITVSSLATRKSCDRTYDLTRIARIARNPYVNRRRNTRYTKTLLFALVRELYITMPKDTRIAWSCSSVDEWTAYQEDYKAWVQDTVGRSPLHESEVTEFERAEKRAIYAGC